MVLDAQLAQHREPFQHVPEVSIVIIPHTGRLEGVSDRPEFEAIRLKTAIAATHCTSRTYRSVTWKDLLLLGLDSR